MKVVSRRRGGANFLGDVEKLQETMNRLRGSGLIPRGVYRFSSFEEADQWMIARIAATHAHRSSTISSSSLGHSRTKAPDRS